MQDNEVGEWRGAHGMQEAYADRRWLTLTTLCVAVLIAQVDTSVVNLAVQPIGRYFDAEGYAAVGGRCLITWSTRRCC